MEGFIDRLAELWKSLFGSASSGGGSAGRGSAGDGSAAGPGSQGGGFRDPDLQEAWEELDEYMNTGRSTSRSSGRARRAEEPGGRRPGGPRRPDESLRQDYANLEVPFGADIEDVRKSYKRLMMKYHPDKHAGSPEKQKMALEISKKINESFERIRDRG